MDPLRQLTTPVAEVRMQAPVRIDEYGEAWVVIDGIETKVPSIKQAKATLARQDALRVKIRADLDATGIRDMTDKVEITLDDGTKDTVEMLKPGLANIFQIGHFPDAEGLIANLKNIEAKELEAARLAELAAKRKAFAALPWYKRMFRKDK